MARKCTATQAMNALELIKKEFGENDQTGVLESYIYNGFDAEAKLAETEAEFIRFQEKHYKEKLGNV